MLTVACANAKRWVRHHPSSVRRSDYPTLCFFMAKHKTIHTLESLHAKCIEEGDCWLWQGYFGNHTPMVYHDGNLMMVRRLIAILSGKSVQSNHKYISNTCNNKDCVCPDHLTFRTEKQHMSHMAKSANQGSITRKIKLMNAARKRSITKLNVEKVQAIHLDQRSCSKIAKDYGVSKSLIAKVKRGDAWADVFKKSNPWAGL